MSKDKKDNPMAAFMLANRLNPEFWQWATVELQPPQQEGDEEAKAAALAKYDW